MQSTARLFRIGEDWLTSGIALDISRGEIPLKLTGETRQKVISGSQIVAKIIEKGEIVYGINTGFGPLCTTKISKEETKILQTNILKSHSVGVGEPSPPKSQN